MKTYRIQSLVVIMSITICLYHLKKNCREFIKAILKPILLVHFKCGSGGGGADSAGPYSKLRDGSAGHFGHFSAQTLPSDEAWIATKGGDWFDGGILIDLHKHNFLANNGIIGNTWNQAYGGINAVNDALADADADGTKQLRTVRAYFYIDYWISMVGQAITPQVKTRHNLRAQKYLIL